MKWSLLVMTGILAQVYTPAEMQSCDLFTFEYYNQWQIKPVNRELIKTMSVQTLLNGEKGGVFLLKVTGKQGECECLLETVAIECVQLFSINFKNLKITIKTAC